jgi:hypothetical protein
VLTRARAFTELFLLLMLHQAPDAPEVAATLMCTSTAHHEEAGEQAGVHDTH